MKTSRFVPAFLGSALTLLVSTVLISMIDAWFTTGQFSLPFRATDAPFAGLGYLALAALIATTALLAIAAIPLILLKRESLVAYLVLCGLLPLLLLILPATEGNVFVFACAATVVAGFWWYAYRRNLIVEPARSGAVHLAWFALLVGVIVFGGAYWSEIRADQIAAAELEITAKEPTPVGGAVVGQNALLFDYRGGLFDYNLQSGKRQHLLDGGVIDVQAVGDGSAWILSATPLPERLDYSAALPPGSFTVSRYRHGRMEALPPVEFAANERPLMIAIHDGAPVLIGRLAAFVKNGDSSEWRKIAFDRSIGDHIPSGGTTALIAKDGKTAFVGINVGEWGGGLAMIDLTKGTVVRPEKRGPDLCDGPLNSDCDPVTGIVSDPGDDRCALASVGLSHFLMHGRILKVCPEGVSVEFTRTLERPSQAIERAARRATIGSAGEPLNTEAFFALIKAQDGAIWAISPFGAYRKEGTKWSRHALPTLEQRGSLNVSQGLPGIVLLSSWRNVRNSLSGPTPMAFAAN